MESFLAGLIGFLVGRGVTPKDAESVVEALRAYLGFEPPVGLTGFVLSDMEKGERKKSNVVVRGKTYSAEALESLRKYDEVSILSKSGGCLQLARTIAHLSDVETIGLVDRLKLVDKIDLIDVISTIKKVDVITEISKILRIGPDPNVYGDGSDGDVTVTADTTLTRNMNYRNLTIDSGVTLTTANYKVRCIEKFVNKGIVSANGLGATGASGTAGGTPSKPATKTSPDGTVLLGGGGGGGGGVASTEGDDISGGNGGNGGGLVWIASSSVFNNGLITCNGEDGSKGGTALYKARDSLAGGSGGGGGGGLIFLVYKYVFSNKVATASKGSGAGGAVAPAGTETGGGTDYFTARKGGEGGEGYVAGGAGGSEAEAYDADAVGGAGSSGSNAEVDKICTAGGGGGGGGAGAANYSATGYKATGGAGGNGGAGTVYITQMD
ncbi:MAG: hypothetical protein QMD13_09315 [Candidatus Bathyarchaeia archaeon]|nr:hypothetical protein [Candidatus Bathyarchaeia archaeon]